MKKKLVDKISIFFSLVALILAFLSYLNSEEALKFEKERIAKEKSPGIVLKRDSTDIIFSVDRENAKLQTVILKFPDSIKASALLTYGRDNKIKINEIESIVLEYFKERVIKKDSFEIVGEMKIPIVIDYEVVIERESKLFREDHFLAFIVSSTKVKTSFLFDYSRFNFKLGIPIESHYFFKFPFIPVSPEKIRKADKEDLKKYLDDRFSQSVDYFKSIGLLK